MTTFEELRDQLAADPDLRAGGAVPLSVVEEPNGDVTVAFVRDGELIEKSGPDADAAAHDLAVHLEGESDVG